MTKNIQFHPGRLPNDPRKPRLRLAKYLTLPLAPVSQDYLSRVSSWPMYLNDRIGDCTCAGAGHIIQALSTYGRGKTETIADSDVLTAYSAVSGYDPETGDNDNGAVMQKVLSYWRKTGIGGHKILAFAEVDINDVDELKAALNIFGTLYVGFDFPDSAMDQFNRGEKWTVVSNAQIEGGHAINVGGYDSAGNWQLVTWGDVQEMDQAFWEKYVWEAWVVITPEWLNDVGYSPTGLDLYALGEDLAELTGGVNPFPAPSPVPTPTPDPVDPNETLAEFLRRWFLRHDGLPHHPLLEAALRTWLDTRQ